MNPNQNTTNSIKQLQSNIIMPISTPASLIMEKKSIFQGDINSDIASLSFNEEAEHGDNRQVFDDSALGNEPLFPVGSSRNLNEEWTNIEKVCTQLFLKEIERYQGRDQQKKGYIMKTVQRRLFGEELPRGHGYKGKLSTKMSILYDELTGRQPRKRRTKNIDPEPVNIKKQNIRPQSVLVGVIGSGEYARLVIQRLLQMQHQVITSNKDTYDMVIADPMFSSVLSTLPPNSLQLQVNLRLFCNACEIILVAIPLESLSLPFYIKKDSFLDLVDRRHHVIDLCIEDLSTSNKVHTVASSKNIRYYDCQIFPMPSTLASFDRNQVSVFLGGEFTPCDYVYTVLYSLGKTLFSGRRNQGIIYKMIISQYMIMQQQVLKEVYSTASSLGLTDPKLLGKMLTMCANPSSIIERSVDFRLLDLHDQLATTIPIETLLPSIKHTFSLPSTYLPVTSIACQVGEDVCTNSINGQTDISHIWDSVMEHRTDNEDKYTS